MIVFSNNGEIDPRAITAFGVSAKEPGSIGFFGTGLKYAIAILLRTGHQVTIHAGKRVLRFGTRTTKIRGKEFSFVTVNGRRAEFTTDVGKTWEVWQAFRELYCNAIDEKGTCLDLPTAPEPVEGKTAVIVEGRPITEAFTEKEDIILSSEPIEKHLAVHIHPGASRYVYYKGIRAHRLNVPSTQTYNIVREMQLTEDRTLENTWLVSYLVTGALLSAQTKEVVDAAVVADQTQWESNLNYGGQGEPSPVFRAAVAQHHSKLHPTLNVSAVQACRTKLSEVLAGAVPYKLDAMDQERLETAISFCDGIGCPVRDYPITCVDFLGIGGLGCATDGRIYISREAFEGGTKVLAGTLLEEFFHLRFEVKDETRTFQNLLINKIVSLGERLTETML